MTLPPRGDPERLEAMARNVAAGLPPLHGDGGTAVAYPEPGAGMIPVDRVPGHPIRGLTSDPHLRYYGPYWGWWTKGTGKARRKEKQPAMSRRKRESVRYHGNLSDLRDVQRSISLFTNPDGDSGFREQNKVLARNRL